MRLLMPYLFVILVALAEAVLVWQNVIPFWPRVTVVFLCCLAIISSCWVGTVRAIEFVRLYQRLAPAISPHVLQGNLKQTGVFVMVRIFTQVELLFNMQSIYGCVGRQRVLTAALAKILNRPWWWVKDKLVTPNLLTGQWGVNWRDYVKPGW